MLYIGRRRSFPVIGLTFFGLGMRTGSEKCVSSASFTIFRCNKGRREESSGWDTPMRLHADRFTCRSGWIRQPINPRPPARAPEGSLQNGRIIPEAVTLRTVPCR